MQQPYYSPPTGSSSSAAGPSSSSSSGISPPLLTAMGPSSFLPPLTVPLKPSPLSAVAGAVAVGASSEAATGSATSAVPLSASATRFRRAIEADQLAALSPNYTAPFGSAQDVVQRLLPYHVWHVPHADIAWVLQSGPIGKADQKQKEEEEEPDKAPPSTAPRQEPRRKRRRKEDYVTTPASSTEAFTDAHVSDLWSRFASLQSRANKLRVQLTGGESLAAFGTESVLQLSRLASDAERIHLAMLQEQLRGAREEARQLGYEVRDVDRIVFNAKRSFDREQAREARRVRLQAGQTIDGDDVDDAAAEAEEARAWTPPIKTPISRPPLQYPATASPSPGIAPSSFPPIAAAGQSPGTFVARRGPGRPPNVVRPSMQAAVTSIPTVSSSTPGSQLPTHPIPLLLPLSSLASLNALGIYPHPAAHLGGSAHVSSPRPPPASQEPAALLLGLSDTMQGNGKVVKASIAPGVARKRDYTLHLSVVLGKLAPQQLQGLAAMMQAQSTAPPPTQATIEARGTTESKHQVVVRIATAAAAAVRSPAPPLLPAAAAAATTTAGAIGVRPPAMQPGAIATRPPRPPAQSHANATASGSGSVVTRPSTPGTSTSTSAAPTPPPPPKPTRGRPKGSGRGPGRPPKNKK